MNVYEDTVAKEILYKAYANIVYSDSEAQELHNHAQWCEYFDGYNSTKAWNEFYDRIEYLEDICDYVGYVQMPIE